MKKEDPIYEKISTSLEDNKRKKVVITLSNTPHTLSCNE